MNEQLEFDPSSAGNTVDLLKAVLAISRQEGMEAIAYEACIQIAQMLNVFTVSFAVINVETQTGHLLTEHISEERTTDQKWFQPIDYTQLPIFHRVIGNQKTFHFHKSDPELIQAPEHEIFKDFIAQQIVLVPVLTSKKTTVGMFLLWERSPTRIFKESDFAFLELLANNIGVIVERTQLLEQSERRTNELEILHDFTLALSSSSDREKILEISTDYVSRMYEDVHCAKMVFSPPGSPSISYSRCFSKDEKCSYFENNQVTKQVMVTGNLFIVENTKLSVIADQYWLEGEVRGLIALPLRAGNQVLGVLQIVFQGQKEFTTRTIHNLETLADRAAVALQNRQLIDKITTQAMTDSLTGIANRRAFNERLKKEIARSKRSNSSFCLLFIDLDGFKRVNDLFGHPEGDKTLQKVAQCFLDSTRATDLVARLGGDEFVILLPETDYAGGQKVASSIQEIFEHCSFTWKGQSKEFHFGASVGVVQFPDQADSIQALYQLGDQMLYADKEYS